MEEHHLCSGRCQKRSPRATDKRKLGDIAKAKRKVFGDIAKTAHELSAMITEPQILPPDGTTPVYRGELDWLAYEFFPTDVTSKLGAPSWATMKSDERCDWAHSFLPEWPTMVELLDQLAIRATQLESNRASVAKRDRGNAYWVIFVRKLYEYFIAANPKFRSVGFAPIKDITNVAMIVRFERQRKVDTSMDIKPKLFTNKKARTIILGATGENLPIKRRK